MRMPQQPDALIVQSNGDIYVVTNILTQGANGDLNFPNGKTGTSAITWEFITCPGSKVPSTTALIVLQNMDVSGGTADPNASAMVSAAGLSPTPATASQSLPPAKKSVQSTPTAKDGQASWPPPDRPSDSQEENLNQAAGSASPPPAAQVPPAAAASGEPPPQPEYYQSSPAPAARTPVPPRPQSDSDASMAGSVSGSSLPTTALPRRMTLSNVYP